MCNSNYAGDKDNRLSVTGHCVNVNRCLILWKSRAKRSHMLLSMEAEYVALSETCTEILFVQMVMKFLEQQVE